MSPCVTITRRNVERYSPGTSCHAGWPLCTPKFTWRGSVARLQKNAPAIFGHAHVAKLRPTVGLHARRSTQIHFQRVAFAGTHVVPPVHVGRLPVFQRALQHAVASQVHVIRDFFGVINHGDLLKNTNGKESSRGEPPSDSFPIKFHWRARAIDFQRATLADSVRTNENPILPGRKSAKNPCLGGFRWPKTQIRFQASKRVG